MGIYKEVKFTDHAVRDSIAERTLLSVEEIAEILNSDRCVSLGYEHGTTRLHRLFYSMPDDTYFVAVLDDNCGSVITVLPYDYDRRMPRFKIHPKVLMTAKEFITGGAVFQEVTAYEETAAEDFEQSQEVEEPPAPTRWRILGYTYETPKPVRLTTVSSAGVPDSSVFDLHEVTDRIKKNKVVRVVAIDCKRKAVELPIPQGTTA